MNFVRRLPVVARSCNPRWLRLRARAEAPGYGRSFRKPFVVVTALLVAAMTAAHGREAPPAWTLAAAVTQARAANPDARMAEARVLVARAGQAQADAARLPRLDLRASYFQTNNPMQGFGAILNQGTFDDAIDFNAPGQLDAFTAGLYARYALYTGGRVTAGRAAARASAEAAVAEREAALGQLALEVVRGYFAIRQAGEAVGALEAARASYEEALRVGRLREEAGQLLKSERLNLEVQHAQAGEQLLAARHQRTLAERRLAFLLGLEPGTPLALVGDDPTVAHLLPPAPGESAARPELRAMQRRVDAADRQARAARSARRPTVGAFASVQTDQGWRRRGDGESWTAGIAAEMPVFDGAETRAKIRAAEAEADAAREALRKLELGLALEREQAQLDHALAREQLAVTEKQVALAEESARLSRERFAAGALLSTELIGVETRLTEARMRRAFAEASERVTVAALRRAVGQPIYE